MRFVENEIYHLSNEGNNQRPVFLSDEHYLLFLGKFRREILPYCNVLSWCLMPKHFDFIIQATQESCGTISSFGGKPMQVLANKIGLWLSSYAQLINKETGNSGSLFRQRTKAKPLSEEMAERKFTGSYRDYLVALMHNIHASPSKAGLVRLMEDWTFSSFRDYAGFRNGSLCMSDLMLELTGYERETFYADSYAAMEKG